MPWSTPETTEEVWLSFLTKVPNWQLPTIPTVVISPHPDDETLGAGGLIAIQTGRGIPTKIIAVSDGEAAYANMPGLAATRVAEQGEAGKWLGVTPEHIIRFKMPDSKISEFEDELAIQIAKHVDAGTLLVAPWTFDPHPDHEACGRAAVRAARAVGAILVFYIFWAWHRSLPQSLTDLPLRKLEIPTDLQIVRANALICHHSQLEHARSGEPILPDVFLAPARRPYEVFIVN